MKKGRFNVEGNWSFKERFQLSSFLWFISIAAFIAPKVTMETVLKEIMKLKSDSI